MGRKNSEKRAIPVTDLTLDLRGRPCPEPVVETRNALQDPDLVSLTVLVSDATARENVTRLAESLGRKVTVEEADPGRFRLVITGHAPPETSPASGPADAVACAPARVRRVAVLVSGERFGQGDEDLGRVLTRSFVKTLEQAAPRPTTLVFMHQGVRLACQGSDVLPDLQRLVDSGMEILACGTCLDFYGLKGELRVGRVSNMLEIVGRLTAADQAIRF
jgi:selenium metabolism protein YedF